MRYFILAVFLASCAVSGPQPQYPSVYVENTGQDEVIVYSDYGRIGEVMAGAKECIRLPLGPDNQVIYARHLAEFTKYASPQLSLMESRYWRWELDESLDITRINLTPTGRGCWR